MIDFGLYAAYVLIGICILAAIALPLVNSISDPRSLLKIGGGVIALLLIIFIGYALSTSETTRIGTTAMVDQGLGDGIVKWISGGLIAMYILLALAVVSIVFTEISGIFR